MSIYETCRDTVAANGGGTIEWVRVAVGELSAVEPELLRFAWEAVTSATDDRGARLEVDWRPARQYCPACARDTERSAGSWMRVCPDCGAPLVVEGGDALEILQLSFLPDEDDDGGAQ